MFLVKDCLWWANTEYEARFTEECLSPQPFGLLNIRENLSDIRKKVREGGLQECVCVAGGASTVSDLSLLCLNLLMP